MGKFDIEPCRGITNPEATTPIKKHRNERRKDLDNKQREKDKQNKEVEFGDKEVLFNG